MLLNPLPARVMYHARTFLGRTLDCLVLEPYVPWYNFCSPNEVCTSNYLDYLVLVSHMCIYPVNLCFDGITSIAFVSVSVRRNITLGSINISLFWPFYVM
jgi:hypothetical protein